jgi:hypothetical protein
VPPSFSIADVGFAIPHVINLDFLFSITLDPQAEAAQVEIGSKGAHHWIEFELQVLKPSAVNPGSTWDQPAPPYLATRDVVLVADPGRAPHHVVALEVEFES